jgi:hypothetical protein
MAEVLRICSHTRRAIFQHRGSLRTEEQLDAFILRAYRHALAEMPDAALRLRVAMALSYRGGDGRQSEWEDEYVDLGGEG